MTKAEVNFTFDLSVSPMTLTFFQLTNFLVNVIHSTFLSLHPLCGGGDLLFLLGPPAAAATCFCSHSKTPTRIISKYLQYAYWPWGICLVNFFAFFSFFNKIQDGRQNPMAHGTA